MKNDKYYPLIQNNFSNTALPIINVVCCVGRVEIQIEIQKGRCTANTDSMV